MIRVLSTAIRHPSSTRVLRGSLLAAALLGTAACEGGLTARLKGDASGQAAIVSGIDVLLASSTESLALISDCATPPMAYLYALGAESKLGSPPLLSAPLGSDASYAFDLPAHNLPPVSGIPAYSVVTRSCAGVHGRIVTKGSGDLTAGTSLILYALNGVEVTAAVKAFDNKQTQALDDLTSHLEGLAGSQDLGKIYDTLAATPALAASFTGLFGIPVNALRNAPPQIIQFNLPESSQVAEGGAASFAISAAHWDKNYQVAMLWQVDDVTQSTERNFTYHPGADSQGLRTISVVVGRAASGRWDEQSPYQKYALAFTVTDQEPATASPLKLLSRSASGQPPTVRSRDLTLGLETGQGLIECATFSRLALTENTEAKPTDFPLKCEAEGEQTLAYTLKSSGDGVKTLRLWAVDSAGQISAAPAVLILKLDTAPLNFASLALANEAADGYINAAEKLAGHPLAGLASGNGFDTAAYSLVPAAATCDATLAYSAVLPLTTSADLTSDGSYKICVKLTNILDVPAVYGASPVFSLSTIPPHFTSLALANEAADGYINAAERSLTHALTGALTASGYTVATYTTALVSVDCSSAVGYGNTPPENNTAAVTAGGSYKVCVRLNDAAGNSAYGESPAVVFDSDAPVITSLPLAGAAVDGRINAAEHATSQAMIGALSASGYTGSPGYALVTAATSCDGALAYGSSSPTADATGFGADGSYKVCVRIADTAGNAAYGSSPSISLDTTAPVFSSLALANDAIDSYLNAAEKLLTHDLVASLVGSGFDAAAYAVAANATACSGPLTYAATVPVNTSSVLISDGSYKVCVKLSDVAGNATYGASAAFDLLTTSPTFTSVALAGDAANGYLNAAEHLLTNAVAGTLVASGYASVDYTLTDAATTCSGASGYAATIPQSDDAHFAADGSYKVCIRLTDAAGNKTYGASTAFTLDQTAPGAFSLSAPAALINATTPTVTWSAASGAATYDLKVAAAAGCASPSQTFTAIAATSKALTILAEGDYYLCLTAKDAAGNTTAASNSDYAFTVDTTPPQAFNITAPAPVTAETAPSAAWDSATGTATYDLIVDDESSCTSPYVQSYTGLAATTKALTALTAGSTYYLCVKAADAAGNVRTATNSPVAFTVDTDKPSFTALTINGDAATTSNTNVTVAFTAVDTTSKITQVCIKLDSSTAPVDRTDPCWVAVSSPAIGQAPAKNLAVTNFAYRIGYASTLYTLYGWVMDEAKNISSLSASGAGTTGADKNAINFGPESPPVISRVVAAGSDSPTDPLTPSDETIAAGADVFVKWRITATNPLGASPVTLEYTTDDTTFTTIATSLANGQNGSCTVNNPGTTIDDTATGCYLWSAGAPTSSYFKIRVKAQDSHALTASAPSAPLNSGALRNIAGNTDLGLGGSAKAAVFFNAAGYEPDPHSLVVTDTGVIYFRDVRRGILKIDPADEVQRLLIPITGVSSGDGGPISAATLTFPYRMLIDPQNRLLIFDNNLIRRVDFAADRIDTIIGGGISSADNVDPLTVALAPATDPRSVFAVLPNGDIYFSDVAMTLTPAGGWRFRVYKPSTGKVTSIYPTGTGTAMNPARDITTCGVWGGAPIYDKTAGAVTGFLINGACEDWTMIGLDANGVSAAVQPAQSGAWFGEYQVSRTGDIFSIFYGSVQQYNVASRSWTLVLGKGLYLDGYCADGTAASSCNITIRDMVMTTIGKIYFADHGMIRTLDQSGNVVSLYGQSLFYGDGGPATEARFHTIDSLGVANSGGITILDRDEWRFREFARNGSVATIAGNGINTIPDTTVDARTAPILMTTAGGYFNDFVEDPATGNIFYNRYRNISYLDRSLNRWVDLAGGGATSYMSADGLVGSAIDMGGYPPRALGFNGTHILASNVSYVGGIGVSNAKLDLYSVTNGTQTSFTGVAGIIGSSFCADGTPAASCAIPEPFASNNARAHYDSYTGKWLLLQVGTAAIRAMAVGGTMGTFVTLGSNAVAFDYYRTADATTNMIFYCGADGHLHKFNVNTSTDTGLTWTISSLQCTGRTLIYDSVRNSILFPYTQNGLAGIGEYMTP